MSRVPLKIGVLGPNQCSTTEYDQGFLIGQKIAEIGCLLFCGGLGGMMEAASAGAKSRDGLTIGILPGERTDEANNYIDIAIPTGMGPMRNMMLVRACDAVIAVHGAYGTLSEIAFALRIGVPVVGLGTWTLQRKGKIDPGIHTAGTPEEAVLLAHDLAVTKRG